MHRKHTLPTRHAFLMQVGALTGELRVERPYRTFLTAVQFCEWKVSHLLQKPIESVCGFLTVLPGAFSAFRWMAVEVGVSLAWPGLQPLTAGKDAA